MASYSNTGEPIMSCCPPGGFCKAGGRMLFRDTEDYATAPVAYFTKNFMAHVSLCEFPYWSKTIRWSTPDDGDWRMEEFMKYAGPQGTFVWKITGERESEQHVMPGFVYRGQWPD